MGIRGYSFDLKERIVALAETGVLAKDVAHHFSVDVSTVRRYVQKHQRGTLKVTPRSPGRPPTLTAVHEAQLLKQLDDHADATLVEHAGFLGRTDAVHDACPHARSGYLPEGELQDGGPGVWPAQDHPQKKRWSPESAVRNAERRS